MSFWTKKQMYQSDVIVNRIAPTNIVRKITAKGVATWLTMSDGIDHGLRAEVSNGW